MSDTKRNERDENPLIARHAWIDAAKSTRRQLQHKTIEIEHIYTLANRIIIERGDLSAPSLFGCFKRFG